MYGFLLAGALLAPGVRNVSSTPFLRCACHYARAQGFRITATTNGRHNRGSQHYRGLALDVSLRGQERAKLARFAAGLPVWGWRLRDETKAPAGQRVWGGPHWHVEAKGSTWQRRIAAREQPRRLKASRSSRKRRTTRR